jgi:dihydrofolate reductase
MNIDMIWAQDKNGGIGKNGKLPWNISEDLQNFKKVTLGHPIIMGRKTWESLPFKPLPNRRNIVLASQKVDDVETYHSIDDCLNKLNNEGIEKIFVIGGRSIYKSFYPKASGLHSTIINENVGGIDTFFPINFDSINKDFEELSRIKLSKSAIYINWRKK